MKKKSGSKNKVPDTQIALLLFCHVSLCTPSL